MRSLLFAIATLLVSQVVSAAPCTPDATTLCLNNQRFRVDVRWEDFEHRTGVGKAIPLTGDTGYFWFFADTNVELVVKVLDGRGLNNHFWVFYGALSNVAYTMTVTDTTTGRQRTYNNPSGTFGSVGDTEAFAASSNPVVPSASLARPEAAPSCPADPRALYLSGCRFRVEANWKDFSGNTGAGTAVPLTADTGYFWFFADTNVELIIKVLDGRGLNGDFWVFYGALSNVEYQITVTDTVTGNVKTYTNPSGRFASVGDTSAFRSGSSVVASADSSRSSSTVIPASGGTLSATAADGTRFTLNVPADALLSDEQVSMTPVSSIGGLPLSGGLRAAVELKPEGLRLLQPATLTIESPTPLSTGSLKPIAFGYHRGGDEFHLFPSTISGSKAELRLMHFSGYGTGSGTDGDIAAQQQRAPASAEDHAQQDIAAGQDIFPVIQAWWAAIVGGLVGAGGDAALFDQAFFQFLTWQSIALVDPRSIPLIEQGWQLVIVALNNAITQSYSECVHDPSRVQKMLHFVAVASRPEILARGGAQAINLARQFVPKCMSFELKFHSRMTLTSAINGYDGTVDATVPFHFELDAVNRPILMPASAPLTYTNFTAWHEGCSTATSSSGSTFTIQSDPAGQWSYIDFPYDYSADPFFALVETRPRRIALTIDHGDPVDRILSLTCGNPPHTEPVPSGPMYWRAGWGQWHGGFLGPNEVLLEGHGWQIRSWDFLGGQPYAQKLYQRSDPDDGVSQAEDSKLEIFHRPQ